MKNCLIFDAIISEEITFERISKSEFFEKNKENNIIGIRDRIVAFINIEEILDNNNLIFKYNKNQNACSQIEAEYIFESMCYENIIYIFVDKQNGSLNKFCRSFFQKDNKDYTKNQMKMTLLYKEKIDLVSKSSDVQFNRI